jgi:hypothetical protein
MDLRIVVAAVFLFVLVALGGARLFQVTGSVTSAGLQQVQVVIDDGSGVYTEKVTLNPKETAFDALKHTVTSQNPVDYEYVSGHASITAIHGVRQDRDHSWIFLVNDKAAEVAHDQYCPTAGDVIKYKFATYDEAAKYSG